MFLLQHFKELTARPSNARELKGIVLQMAMQGKLTAKWRKENPDLISGDNAASALLEKIKKEKAALIKEGKIRKDKPLPPIEEEEIPYELPEGWVWCRLGEIIRISSGDGLTSRDMDKEGGIPVYGGNGITGYHNDFNVSVQTIVIGRVGFYCGSVHLTEERAWVTDNAFITRYSRGNINQEFLVWLLKGTDLRENDQATAQPVISGRKVYPIKVGFPPVAEQKYIAYSVENLFAQIDKLEELTQHRIQLKHNYATSALHQLTNGHTSQEWKNLQPHFKPFFDEPQNIQQLRETILQLAVQGKLTTKWHQQNTDIVPAAKLLNTIHELNEDRKRKNFKDPNFTLHDDLYPPIPENWEYTTIKELYERNIVVDYGDGNHGSLYPRKGDFGNKGILFVTAKQIQNGRVIWSKVDRLDEKKANYLTKGWSKEGDVILTHNATVGRVAIVLKDEIGEEFLLGTSATFYRLNPNCLDQYYFYYALCSPIWQEQLKTIMQQTTRNQVSIQKQAHFKIPVPPLKEQKAIVQQVSALMTFCDELEQQVQESQALSEQLMQAVVREVVEHKVEAVKGTPVYQINEEVPMAAEPSASKTREAIPANKKAFAKQVLGGKIVSLTKDHDSFSRIKLQKLQYLAEHIAEADLNWNYYRKAAGPYDPKFMNTIAGKFEKSKWFKERNYRFTALEKVEEIDKYYPRYFSPVGDKLDKLFSKLGIASEEQTEIVATLYAVWNNRIIKKQPINDDILVEDFLEWSPRKGKYDLGRLYKALQWMRDEGFVPTGFGKVIKEKKG